MTTVTFRIPDELNKILEELCKEEDRSKSWFMRKALEEKLEDWRDTRAGLKALKKHKRNPQLISHSDLMRKLKLTEKDIA